MVALKTSAMVIVVVQCAYRNTFPGSCEIGCNGAVALECESDTADLGTQQTAHRGRKICDSFCAERAGRKGQMGLSLQHQVLVIP